MDDLLPSLYEKKLLTDIECRIIVCIREPSDKHLALSGIVAFKNKENAAQLMEIIYAQHTNEERMLHESDSKHEINVLDSGSNNNPMLNNAVIKCVFRFLTLGDIKICRLVSRQWNSTTEIVLRKRAKIHFRTDGLRPETFLAVSKFSLPDLPFSAFKFSECKNKELYWRESELENFFEKWGKNIQELNLDNIHLECARDSSKSFSKYDVTPWFENTSKITSLTIEGSDDIYDDDDEGKSNSVSLSFAKLKILPQIKTFILKGSSFEIPSGKRSARMFLVNIKLSNITGKRGDAVVQQFRYNSFFDFGQAVNNCEQKVSEFTFGIGEQAFQNTDLLHLDDISVENWKEARGYVRRVELRGIPFTLNLLIVPQ